MFQRFYPKQINFGCHLAICSTNMNRIKLNYDWNNFLHQITFFYKLLMQMHRIWIVLSWESLAYWQRVGDALHGLEPSTRNSFGRELYGERQTQTRNASTEAVSAGELLMGSPVEVDELSWFPLSPSPPRKIFFAAIRTAPSGEVFKRIPVKAETLSVWESICTRSFPRRFTFTPSTDSD